MYAIVEIAGQQFKVENNQQIFVNRIEEKEGSKIELNDVLLIDDNDNINVGTPIVSGAKVTAKVLEHLKGDKVIVFKKKRRKGYNVKNGHRQYLTKLEIQKIDSKGSVSKKSSPKKEVINKEEKNLNKKAVTKKAVTKKAVTKKAVAKKAVAKKAVTKKAVTKKAVTKKAANKSTTKK